MWNLFLFIFAFAVIATTAASNQVNHNLCNEELTRVIDSSAWHNISMEDFDNYSLELLRLVTGGQGHELENTIEGGSFSDYMIEERRIYRAMASHSCVKTICEVGFNSGHSALNWLTSAPNALVIMFDLWNHAYAAKAEAYLRNKTELNPQRLRIYRGDSSIIVTNFIERIQTFGVT